MGSEENPMEASSEKVVVYLHGFEQRKELWYRVEFEAAFPIAKELSGEESILREPGMKISPVGSLDRDVFGTAGRWDVIGDEIYWIAGYRHSRSSRMYLCEDLLKHVIARPESDVWEVESSSMKILRRSPFFAALGAQKLCVVSGHPWRSGSDYVDGDDYDEAEGPWRSRCGQIYDLYNKTWTCLDANYDLVSYYDTFFQATLVLKDGGQEPTQIVFYSLHNGSVFFLDLSTGVPTSNSPLEPAFFADVCGVDLEDLFVILPEGLNLDVYDIRLLRLVAHNVPAVFSNDTFYWFTPDLRLFGYNIKDQKWLRSHPLREKLPLVDFDPVGTPFPILLGLGNEKFLVIVADDDPGSLTMASFTVARVEDSLTVSVGSILPLSFDQRCFRLFDGKAICSSRSSDHIPMKMTQAVDIDLQNPGRAMEVAAEASSEMVVVCLHGFGETNDLWFRIELPVINENDCKSLLAEKGKHRPLRMPKKKISPVASLCRSTCGTAGGTAGSWDNIGEDIYWIGGFRLNEAGEISLCKTLLEHNMNQPDPTHWAIKSSSMNIPRISPFLAAIGTKKQLCVVGGTEYCPAGGDNDDRWSKCGEIYDLENNTWTLLDAEYKLVNSYDTFNQAALVQKDGKDPTQIVFYSLADGSTLFFDIPSGTSEGREKHAHFDVWGDILSQTRPGDVQRSDLSKLRVTSKYMTAAFTNSTFYWFTYDFRLFGYDILHQRWLRSPYLTSQLPITVFSQPRDRHPILVGVGNGKLLLIVSQDPGELMIASLSVKTNEKTHEDSDSTDEDYDSIDEDCDSAYEDSVSLSVTVNFLQPLYVDDLSFEPVDGKAM